MEVEVEVEVEAAEPQEAGQAPAVGEAGAASLRANGQRCVQAAMSRRPQEWRQEEKWAANDVDVVQRYDQQASVAAWRQGTDRAREIGCVVAPQRHVPEA